MYRRAKNLLLQKSEFGQKWHLQGFVPTATILALRLPDYEMFYWIKHSCEM